jgi:hypothetical protein
VSKNQRCPGRQDDIRITIRIYDTSVDRRNGELRIIFVYHFDDLYVADVAVRTWSVVDAILEGTSSSSPSPSQSWKPGRSCFTDLSVHVFTELVEYTPVDHAPVALDLVAGIWYHVEVYIFEADRDQFALIEEYFRFAQVGQLTVYTLSLTSSGNSTTQSDTCSQRSSESNSQVRCRKHL